MGSDRRGARVLPLCAASLALLVYLPTVGSEFISLDDPVYVTDNPHVLGGLTLEGFLWSLTTTDGGSWHPLTWWSHQLAVELFGTRPWGHHLVNAICHAAAAGALCSVLAALTGAAGAAFFAAALFAVHPLHVESVAWVAERKDVLSALLWMLAIESWLFYLRRPRRGRYLGALGVFGLGVAAKPMVLTLPLVLLALDFWPLGRHQGNPKRGPGELLWEKAPFVLLSLAAGVLTLLAQHALESLEPLADLPARFTFALAGSRFANAAVSTAFYLVKAAWPAALAVFYPYPAHAIGAGELIASAALVAGITLLATAQRRRRPWIATGWAWYLVALLPVAGIVQVGLQARADRYAYLPLVGVSVAVVWSVRDAACRRGTKLAAVALGAAALAGLAATGLRQAGFWRDTETLFTHALAVTEGNHLAHRVLGELRRAQGRHRDAERHFREELRLAPGSPGAHNRLGMALSDQGRLQESTAEYREAIRRKPDHDEALNNLGVDLTELGRPAEGERFLRRALEVSPHRAEIWINLGDNLAAQLRPAEARECYLRALGIQPDFPGLREHLGRVSEAPAAR